MSIRFDAALFGVEFPGRRLFENVRTVSRNCLDQSPEILSRMKFRLVGEPNSGHPKVRDRVEIGSVESHLLGEIGIFFQFRRLT